jgi:hypothetical protein
MGVQVLNLERNEQDDPSWQRLETDPAGNVTNQLAQAYRRAFASADGQAVLDDLRDRTRQALPPGVSDAALRHIEGQRYIVQWIERQIVRGMSE